MDFMLAGSRLLPHALPLLGAALLSGACGGGRTAAPPAPPPARVELAPLQAVPVDETSEYIATLKSLRSTEIRPQVDGIITRIVVKSGDRVRAGATLLQIDPSRQQAAVSSQDATRAATEADLGLARTELERVRALFKGGAVSKQELDQAEALVKRLEAQRAAAEAQVREARVQLQYFDVVAPTSGIVGDVPVRVGNRVTSADVLTTIDENASLEVHVNVPIARAPSLAAGLPLEILGPDGKVAVRTKVTFISPTVDATTQTVLIKGLVSGVSGGLRSAQYVRARVIWDRRPALSVPVVAVQRINGQYFVFVAESQEGKLVARQRPVRLGPIRGNDYPVVSGLEAGQRVVVSGTQRLVDGAPIAAS
jgi:RND family efflux transporter MFP subunit